MIGDALRFSSATKYGVHVDVFYIDEASEKIKYAFTSTFFIRTSEEIDTPFGMADSKRLGRFRLSLSCQKIRPPKWCFEEGSDLVENFVDGH